MSIRHTRLIEAMAELNAEVERLARDVYLSFSAPVWFDNTAVVMGYSRFQPYCPWTVAAVIDRDGQVSFEVLATAKGKPVSAGTPGEAAVLFCDAAESWAPASR